MKIDINLPSDAAEIPLHRYQSFMEVIDEQGKEADENFITSKMIELFCDIEQDKVKMISLSSINDLNTHFRKIFDSKLPIQKRFMLNGVEFGMIPDLENISFGEYIDLESNISKWETMHKAMAVLYRPIIEYKDDKYLIEKYEGSANYSEVMLYAPLSIALSSTLFFWSLGQELLKATITYLERELVKMNRTKIFRWRGNSRENGDGIKASIQLLRDDLKNLIPLQNYPYTNA